MSDIADKKEERKQWCGKGGLSRESWRKKCLDEDNSSITDMLTWIIYSRGSATVNHPPRLLLASLLICPAYFTRILKEEEYYVKTRFYFISTFQDLMEVPAHFVDDAHMSQLRKREELLSSKIYFSQKEGKRIKRSESEFFSITSFTFIASFNGFSF